jgi:hypothetical protein
VRVSLHRARRVKAAQVVLGVVGARLLGLDTPCYTGCPAREAASNALSRGNNHCISAEEGRALLSHANDSAKHFCHLQQHIPKEKRPVAVLGETRPVYPDKGCVGEVLGSVYLLPRISQDGSMELMVTNAIRH